MFFTAASSAWAPSDQFDALRETVFAPGGMIQLVRGDHRQGRMRWDWAIAPGKDASFGSFMSDAIQVQRLRHSNPAADDAFVLSWFRSGTVVQEDPRGAQSVVQAGGLHVYDTTRPMRFHRSATHCLTLVLPRLRVLQALRGHVPVNGALSVSSVSLAPFLIAQLDLLERHGAGLAPAQLACALEAAAQLAVSCLREASQLLPHLPEDEQPHSGLLAAARQYMGQHLHDHGLEVGRIAAAVHSSRSRLYRAFAEQGSSIAAELREMRLQAARHKLERTREPIGTLSWHCGFTSAPVFSRMFRARFGAAPQEWRAYRQPL